MNGERKYKSFSIPEQSETKVKVTKLVFLIHPGFISDPAVFDRPMTNDEQKHASVLLDKYIEAAQKLSPTDLVLVFTHNPKYPRKFNWSIKDDLTNKKLYISKLHELKAILGPRMVILSDENSPIDKDAKISLKALKRIVEARGYVCDKKVPTEAWGETLGVCVDDGAYELNKAGKFKNKTEIRTELTNEYNSDENKRSQKKPGPNSSLNDRISYK